MVVQVEPRAFGRYPYRLLTEHGLVGVTGSVALPPIRIQPKSEHLHAVGPAESVAWFSELAKGFTRGLRLTASRVDVFSDWHGLELTVATPATSSGVPSGSTRMKKPAG